MRDMIYDNYISFEELLEELRSLENEINSLSIKTLRDRFR